MTIQSDPMGQHLVNGYGWERIKDMFRGMARANGADFSLPFQSKGAAQAAVNIVEKMEHIEQEEKFYTVPLAFKALLDRMPDVELDGWSSEFTRQLYVTYCELRQTVAPLRDLEKGTYYRCKSGMLARVLGCHVEGSILIYYGVIFDVARNHEGRWDQMGGDRSGSDGNNLIYEAKDQRTPRVILAQLDQQLEGMAQAPEPIGEPHKRLETAQELLAKARGRIED